MKNDQIPMTNKIQNFLHPAISMLDEGELKQCIPALAGMTAK
jgi:hypothetical protein